MCLLIPFVAIALICILALFLLIGAAAVGIETATFGKAVAAVVVGAAGATAVHFALAETGIGEFLAGLAGFILEVLVAMTVFDTTFWRALGACLIAWGLQIVVVLLLFGLGMLTMAAG